MDITKNLRIVPLGYNKEDVAEFIESICEHSKNVVKSSETETEELNVKLNQYIEENSKLRLKLSAIESDMEAISNAMLRAEHAAQKLIDDAEERSKTIVENAEREARRIVQLAKSEEQLIRQRLERNSLDLQDELKRTKKEIYNMRLSLLMTVKKYEGELLEFLDD